MIAGVAKGLANRFDIPDWVVRVGFIVTAFMGGTGLVAYLACWALIRDEAEAEPPAANFFSRATTPQAWLGVGLIVVALMLVLMFVVVRWTFAPMSPGLIWAGLVLLIGILLYTGQLRFPLSNDARPKPPADAVGGHDHKEGVQQSDLTRADASPVGATQVTEPVTPVPLVVRPPRPPRERSALGRITVGVMMLALAALAVIDIRQVAGFDPQLRHYLALATTIIGVGLLVGSVWGRARWLLLLAVALVPAMLISPFTAHWQSQGTNVFPANFSELQDSYRIEVGRIHIDLGNLPWNGEEVEVRVSAEVGEITVLVPYDVAVAGSAQVDVGRINVPGTHSGWGFTPRTINFDHPGYADEDIDSDGITRGRVRIVSSADVGSISVFFGFPPFDFERN